MKLNNLITLVAVGLLLTMTSAFSKELTWETLPAGWKKAADGSITGSAGPMSIAAKEAGQSFEYEAEITLVNNGQPAQGGLVFWSATGNYKDGFVVWLHKTPTLQRLELFALNSGGLLEARDFAIEWDQAYHLRVVAEAESIKVYVNHGKQPALAVNGSFYGQGRFGLFRAQHGSVVYSKIKVSRQKAFPLKLTVLSSQLGYQTEGTKRAYVRNLNRDLPQTKLPFSICDAKTHEVVYSGKPTYWGGKWGSHWWVMDFSKFKTEGKYYLKLDETKTNPFDIGATALMKWDMVDIAVSQLDERHNHGEPNTYLHGKLRFHGRWMTPDGKHPQGIYRDCMSNYAEIQSIGMTTMGLISLYHYQKDAFSAEDQKRIRDYIVLGADYITACQRKTDDPKTNGRFAHSILVNTRHDGCGWAGNVYNWHDMAYAMVVLCKSYESVKGFDEAKAKTYLDAAKLAYTCASHRPYHLPEEYETAKRDDDFDPIKDYDKARWTPKLHGFRTDPTNFPVGWGNYHEYSRMFYDKPNSWKEPQTLKTREKLPFLYGCMLLHRITGDAKYLDTAITFADSIAERQFTDWQNPIEGVYGTFYEFEGDNKAFSIESGQAGGHFMGHIDALNVNGFTELLRMKPDHPKAASWLNVVKTYTDRYVRKSAGLNPLGIHPISVYSNPEYGGVKFFMNLLHGATGHYGQMSGHLLELADFLNDESLVPLAKANLHFYTGLNPGIPEWNRWKSYTLINKVGPSYYNTGGEGIKGGVINGFSAGRNWTLRPVAVEKDAPDIAGGQEDWVAHSHPYVGAVARLEAPFKLTVKTLNGGKPVAAEVNVTLSKTKKVETDSQGIAVLENLQINRQGTVSVTHGGKTITRKLATIPGGTLEWTVDVAQHADLSLSIPKTLKLNGSGKATLTISNAGLSTLKGSVVLLGAGVSVKTSRVVVGIAPGTTQTIDVDVTSGGQVMPYMLRAVFKLDSGTVFVANKQGLTGK